MGCKEKVEPVETPSIPVDKMIKLLADVHLVEGYAQSFNRSEKDSVSYASYEMLYRFYGIDEKEFDENLRIYLSDPVGADSLYVKVIEELNQIETAQRKKVGPESEPTEEEDPEEHLNKINK